MSSLTINSSSVPCALPSNRRHVIRRATDYFSKRARFWTWGLATFLIIETASTTYVVVSTRSHRRDPTAHAIPFRCDMAEYTWLGFHRIAVPQ